MGDLHVLGLGPCSFRLITVVWVRPAIWKHLGWRTMGLGAWSPPHRFGAVSLTLDGLFSPLIVRACGHSFEGHEAGGEIDHG